MSNLWQQPYVNVFKHFNVPQWKKASKEGEVTPVMDKSVKATVFKITGHIPAGNYIQLPRTGSLGLTGRYFYLLFCPVPTKYFVVHVDVATQDSLVVRLSFSNLFKEFKSTATWLQFPFLCNPAKGSVAFYAAAAGVKENSGPAPGTTRWTVLCLDLNYILSTYLNRRYAYVKSMRLCANMLVKNVFTSDVLYDPGISMAEAKRMGGGRHVCPFPREFGFPVPKGDQWDDLYDLIRFPPEGEKKPFDSIQFAVDDSNRFYQEEDAEEKPCRITAQTKNISRCVSERVSMIHKLTTPKKPVNKQTVAQEIPELEMRDFTNNQSNVHIYPHADLDMNDTDNELHCKCKVMKEKVTLTAPVYLPSQQIKSHKTLEPDPIMKLKRIVGFGGATFRDALWSGDQSSVVYPCHAVVVVMRVSNGHQRFFIGHTDKVSCLSQNGSSTVLASGQTGLMSVVRLWKFQTGECLSMCKVHAHSLFSLSFAQNGNVLCGAGKDRHGKNMVVIWNTIHVLKKREVTVLAKAHTDVDISRMIIVPFDDQRMVSCGRDNIRFWRLKDGTLRSAPVNMGDHHSMDFTDLCFASAGHAVKAIETVILYVCSRSGHMFELDYQKVNVRHVRRLLPISTGTKNGDKNKGRSGSGLGITSLSMNETFCVTGSEDGFLRLWPLDFAHVYLEAEHEGAVTAVSLSSDGMKILAGTSAGNLGVLDVATRDYTTIMRSHTKRILSIALDPCRKHIATVSSDQTIRVWDAETLQQLYDFSAPQECPTTICYHPSQQVFVCGFESGAVRVFNVVSTCLLAEHTNHRGAVTGVAYSPDGEYLYSSCSLGFLVGYSASDVRYSVLRVLPSTVARGTRFAPDALAVSSCGRKLAFVGPSDFTVTVVDARHMSELMRVDLTNLNPGDPKESIDTAVKVTFTPENVGHLLVTTTNNRLVKLDLSGRMVAEVNNIHRTGCSSLVVSKDGKYLITAGDKVLKVWDYTMRLDINFQVFIGHSESASKVVYTPDSQNIISAGEAIYIWNNLAARSPTPPVVGRMLSHKEADDHFVPGIVQQPLDYSQLEYPRSTPPRPVLPTLPSSRVEDLSSIHNGDDTDMETVISEPDAPPPDASASAGFAVHGNRRGDNHGYTDSEHSDKDIPNHSGKLSRSHSVKDLGDTHLTMQFTELSINKVGQDAFTKHSPHQPKPRTQAGSRKQQKKTRNKSVKSSQLSKPSCQKHYIPRDRSYAIAQRRYTAPPNQAGLRLSSVIGYSGNGRDNMVWCPDTGLFVYSSGCIVVVEDLSTGKQTHLQGHAEEVSTLAVRNDHQMLASASGCFEDSSQCQVCVWDLSTHTCTKVLTHHKHQVVCMAYSRDDRFLITVGDYHNSEVVVWSTISYTVLTSAKTDEAVNCLKWDPFTVNEFASVGEEGTLLFWLLDETTSQATLSVHEAGVPDEVLKPEGNAVTSFTSLEYTGGSTLYVTATNGKVSAWDTRHNSCFLHWDADTCEIDCVGSGAGKFLTGSTAGHLRLWAVDSVELLRQPRQASQPPVTAGLTMEDEMTLDGGVVSAHFDENLEMGIVGTTCGTLWYINWQERTSIRLISGHSKPVTGISMAPAGLMATSCEDGSVRVWVLRNKEQALQFQVKDQVCNCVAFAPPSMLTLAAAALGDSGEDNDKAEDQVVPTLVAGYGDGTVRVFDVNTVEMQLKLHPHSVSVTAIAFSAEGRMILSGGSDGLIAVSSTASGITVRVIRDHKGAPITNFDVPTVQVDDMDPGVSSPTLWLACSADRRVSVWSSDWGCDLCDLVDWLTFPAPAFTPDGAPLKGKAQYSVLPTSLAKFSPEEPDIVVYTGYGMNKCLQFYSLSHRKVVRTASLTHWATCLDLAPDSPLVAVGIKERLLKLMDYYESSFQDYASYDDIVSLVRFTLDGTQLVTAAQGQVLVWDLTL
ncbi:WD repeat-containing protein 90-like isoform X2 [Littorina saxatilis]|uniref:WD repeat-containing protein 90 n=1 Tax=Littorina saxatilis TaxID=31220 RepID=A0AAN9BVF4_9CAEN